MAAEVVVGEPAGQKTLKAGESLLVTGDGAIAVTLPGIARLRLTGPAGDAVEWRLKGDKAEATLASLLEPFETTNWKDLENRVRERENLAAQQVRAQAELSAALGKDRLADLLERHAALEADRKKILALELGWATAPPDVPAMRASVVDLKQQAAAEQGQAKTDWQAADKLCVAAETALAKAAQARSLNQNQLAQAVKELTPLTADGLSLTERHERLAERRRERESAEDALQSIETSLANLPADAPQQAGEVRQRIAALDAEIQTAREAYQQDEAVVRTILLQGSYTSLAVAEERVQQLEEDEAAERLRLEAIQRLKAAVDAAKAKALAGIAEPVEIRATDLLERIAGRPLARVRLGSGMEVTSIEPVASGGDAMVKDMSVGEQEQIYFATRLALAEVLAGGERQTLVLDDPLVNTDADRLGRALRLIDEKRDRFQFVILTCHPGRYLELPHAISRPLERAVAVTTSPEGA
jgi:hypothetical protein